MLQISLDDYLHMTLREVFTRLRGNRQRMELEDRRIRRLATIIRRSLGGNEMEFQLWPLESDELPQVVELPDKEHQKAILDYYNKF